MATTKYSDLLDDVLPHLAADPSDPVTEYAIKRAVIDFCAGSWIWKHIPDPIDVQQGESAYDLELPPGADIAVVLTATVGVQPLSARSIEWLDAQLPGWRTNPATPRHFTQVDTEQVILAPVPEVNLPQGLALSLALQPAQSAKAFPRWISNQYLYALADGATARLMLMPGKPWTDLANGQDRRARFEAAIANARTSALAALGRAPTRTTPQH